jgi:methyl-accepting chemotaxis protein
MGVLASLGASSLDGAKLAALDRAQAIIEFDTAGNVLHANANFLAATGYSLSEIVGRHHRMFMPPGQADGSDYRSFWNRLAGGEVFAGQFMRVGKGGREIWIEASYNPVLDRRGRTVRVVKFATDITARKVEEAARASLIAAIEKSQAVIEFDLDGRILRANANFLGAMGYAADEIVGRHHSMFVDPALRGSAEYRLFWEALRRGEYQDGQFKRIGREGREIWIQASYNPVLDAAGRPTRVVKFATDITGQKRLLDRLRTIIDENFGEIDRAVARSTTEAGSAALSADATSGNVQTMAAAAEELACSIGEIAQSMATSRSSTDAASEQVRTAGALTRKLTVATGSMTDILSLIQTIAGQINLLALNATIESARAGEAGRGFAVVAQEVKNLANQAAKATEQIGAEISGVQAISGDVATALDAIGASVETMRAHVMATASSVEEQSVVTRDMSSNMQATAEAVGHISGSVSSIVAAITQVTGAVSGTREAARVLAR